MDLSNEQILLERFIDEAFAADSSYETKGSLFEFLVPSKLLAARDLSDEEIARGIVGGPNDGGCDSIYVFCDGILLGEDADFDKTIRRESHVEAVIFQTKVSKSFKTDVFLKWKDTARDLLSFSRELDDFAGKYNPGLLDAFGILRAVLEKGAAKGSSLSMMFVDAANAQDPNPQVEAQAKELGDLVKERLPLPTLRVGVEFAGARRLISEWNPLAEREVGIVFSSPLICVQQRTDFIGLVTLTEYQRFLADGSGRLRSFLFEANVRDYQGNVQVNRAMAETLRSDPSVDFWWLNNGVTILAKEARLSTGDRVVMADPRIVNGLQTSQEIFNYASGLPEGAVDARKVLVRVIVPDGEETRDKVILATNNQTAIAKTSLRATDPIHLQIEQYMRPYGLYYDRRKNYYKNQGKKPEEIISVSFMGQCLMTLVLGEPDQARARPSTILENGATFKRLFPKSGGLECYYRVARVGRDVISAFEHLDHGLERSVVSDLRFYVLFAVVARAVGSTDITRKALEALDPKTIGEADIRAAIDIVYPIYVSCGGNPKAAKSAAMREAVKGALEAEMERTQSDGLREGDAALSEAQGCPTKLDCPDKKANA